MHLWHCSALLLCRSNPQVSCGGASCQEHCSWLLTGLSLPPVKPVSSLLMDLLLRWKVSLFTFSCWLAKFISPPFPRRSSSSLHVLMLCLPVIPSSLVSCSALSGSARLLRLCSRCSSDWLMCYYRQAQLTGIPYLPTRAHLLRPSPFSLPLPQPLPAAAPTANAAAAARTGAPPPRVFIRLHHCLL